MKERMKKLRKNHKGFSLVELIIVIAIMAILVGILAPQFIKYVNNSKISSDVTSVDNAVQAVNAAVADQKSLGTSTDLAAAMTAAGVTDTFSPKSVAAMSDFSITIGTDGTITKVEATSTVGNKVKGTVYPDADNATTGYYALNKK